MEPQKFRKKPVEIEAMQLPLKDPNVVEKDFEEKLRLVALWIVNNEHDVYMGRDYLLIKTLEGEMRADPGDWIIRGVQGEFYPCKPDIFEKTYDKVLPTQGNMFNGGHGE